MVLSLLKQKTFLVKVLPILVLVIVLKCVVFFQKWEIFGASPMLSGIVTANMFLLAFLLAGVLSDFKESEKLPGELATSLEVLVDECIVIQKNKNDKKAKECLLHVRELENSIKRWLYKKEEFTAVMRNISKMNDFIAHFENVAHASSVARMKQEQNNIRKSVTRINTIRETNFISAGYAIAEGVTFLLILGLLFVKTDRLYESLFFVGIIAFVLTYVVEMIRDLDNPFEYYEGQKGDEVSLAPLDEFEKALPLKIAEMK